VLVVIGQWQVWGGWHDGGVGAPPSGHRVARAVLALVIALPLVWRRRFPLAVAAAVCAGIVTQLLVVTPYVPFLTGLLPMVIANYSAAAYGRRWRVTSLLLVVVTQLVIYARIPQERTSGEVLFGLFVALGTWVVGDVVRTRFHGAERLLGDARHLVAQSEAATAAALAEERSRIARELHDVIAHSVSVMGVQAGAARMLMDRRPDAARAALLEVEATARSAVEELRRLLTVLRDDGDAAEGLAPQPGLAQLGELVAQVRAAGLAVTLDLSEGAAGLPPGVDLTAYRIVQEALTNALKHSGAATLVTVRAAEDELRIDVTNDPPAQATPGQPTAAGARHGLIGMRERVQLYGGRLVAGPCADGGFHVGAVLPTDEARQLGQVS
jgi:signal transduction histidine kinase